MSEQENKSELKEAFDQAYCQWGPWVTQQKKNLLAYGGNPWSAEDRRQAQLRKIELMSFPQMRRCVKWLSGYERDHRLSIMFDPQEGGDDVTAGQMSAVALWALQHKNGNYVISDTFEGALKTGINLVNTYNDRNSNTRFARFMYNQFVLDPAFTRVDLEDCQYGILRKYVDKTQAKMLLPGKESYINKLGETPSDDKSLFPNYQQPNLYGKLLYAFDEFQQRTLEKRRILLIKPLQEEIIVKGGDKMLKQIIQKFMSMGIPLNLISVIDRYEPTIRVTRWLDGEEMTRDIDPFGLDDFSFTPFVCYLDAEQDDMVMKSQSLIHGIVDSQRASDKRMMSIISWMEKQAGAGMDYEKGSLVDDRDAFMTGSGAPRVFNKDALKDNRVKDRQSPNFPPGILEVWGELNKQIPKSLNINLDMFGDTENPNLKIAGVLAKLRIAAGLVGLRDIYDNRELSVKTIGRKVCRLIQRYPASKIKRILNKEPSKAFFSRMFGKYDCVVTEGMNSDTQRSIAYAEAISLKELGMKLQERCPISWKRIIQMSPIQQKQEILAEIEKDEQQTNQQQAKQAQQEMELQELAKKKLQGEIYQDAQLAEQQRTAAIENSGEAVLDKVDTLVKLQKLGADVDIQRAKVQNDADRNQLRYLEMQYKLMAERIKAEAAKDKAKATK